MPVPPQQWDDRVDDQYVVEVYVGVIDDCCQLSDHLTLTIAQLCLTLFGVGIGIGVILLVFWLLLLLIVLFLIVSLGVEDIVEYIVDIHFEFSREESIIKCEPFLAV
jgi:hypothetical protein